MARDENENRGDEPSGEASRHAERAQVASIIWFGDGLSVMIQLPDGQKHAGRLPVDFNRAAALKALEKGPLRVAICWDEESGCPLVLHAFPTTEQEEDFANVTIEAKRVELRAGNASLVLENGKIAMRGDQLSSRAANAMSFLAPRIRLN